MKHGKRERIPDEAAIAFAMAAKEKREKEAAQRCINLGKRLIRVIEREARAAAIQYKMDPEEFLDYLESQIAVRPLERQLSKNEKNQIYGDPHTKAQKSASAPISFTKTQ